MSSAAAGDPKMIVQYEWILEDVEEEPQTITSKMISFRGEKVFRVGFKNHVTSPVLFFMAIDLKKIGMKTEGVMCGIKDSGVCPETMWPMAKENTLDDNKRKGLSVIPEDGSLQLFTANVAKQVNGTCTFVFRICLEGSHFGYYSYQLSDRLAKDQLWDAVTKNKNFTDVEIVGKGKTFFAHKAILAARSKVFEAEFTKEQQGNDQPVQIHFDDVEPSTVEQFLYFIYTGESMGTFADEELLKLAEKYQLTTLIRLCRTALEKINPIQMAKLATSLNKEAKILSTKIRPEKETEIFFDRTTPTFRCKWRFHYRDFEKCVSVMKYQNEDIFFAELTVKIEDKTFHHPLVHFLCPSLSSFGLKVEDVYCNSQDDPNLRDSWYKMEPKTSQKNAELRHFTTLLKNNFHAVVLVSLDIKTVSKIADYYYEMMDDTWMYDFWTAATNQKFTDVEIFVGTVKVMEAHRVILSARSPVMDAALNKINNTGKSVVTFGAVFDVEIVKFFVKFLYTGLLETAKNKQLLELAKKYKVETLTNICQFVDTPLDIEDFTNNLLEL